MLILDSFKLLVLFPLHISSKNQQYASYENTDKRNTIHTSIQTEKIKLKEGKASRLEVPKVAREKIQNKEQNLLVESSKDTLLSKENNNVI